MDQAERLRLVVGDRGASRASGPNRPGRITTVTSGKGGVGKTNLSVNLGIELASRGKKVLVMDADLGLADLNILVGVTPRYSLYHVFKRGKRLNEIIENGPGGISMIAGATGLSDIVDLGPRERKMILDGISGFEEAFDEFIIDTGAGLTPMALRFIRAGDEIILVTTPEPTAMADAYGMMKALIDKEVEKPVRLVVNRAPSVTEARRTFERMRLLAGRFLNLHLLDGGFILEDKSVGRAVLSQKPFSLHARGSKAASSVKRIADIMEGASVDFREGSGLLGFFERLFAS